jgi:hypothetical protein
VALSTQAVAALPARGRSGKQRRVVCEHAALSD